MHSPLSARLLLVFALLFAQQAGAAHALHHALENLAQHQENQQAPHSDNCEQCANYAQLGSALSVSANDFIPPVVSGTTIQHLAISFRSTHVLAAAARGPPASLQKTA